MVVLGFDTDTLYVPQNENSLSEKIVPEIPEIVEGGNRNRISPRKNTRSAPTKYSMAGIVLYNQSLIGSV
jgi:hypothetical protein